MASRRQQPLLVALPGVGAVASEDPIPNVAAEAGLEFTVAPEVGTALSEAEDAFLEQEAMDRGLTLDQVKAERELNGQFGVLATELESDFPDYYVQAEWRRDEVPQAVLVLRGPLPSELLARIEAASMEVKIVHSTSPSVEEATEALRTAMEALAARSEVIDAAGSFDPLTGDMTIEYSGIKLPPEAEAALRADLPLGEQITYRHAGTESIATDDYVGGNPLGGCTAGFAVRSGNTFGVSTAGHCSLNTNYYYMDGFFTHGGFLNKSYGDARWAWSLSGSPLPQFRETTTSVATVTSYQAPKVADGYCKYGRTSFTSCSYVYSLNNCVTTPYGTVCRIVFATTSHVDGGDSGGPNFSGGIALGLTKGTVTYGGVTRDMWTTVSNLLAGANVSVYES